MTSIHRLTVLLVVGIITVLGGRAMRAQDPDAFRAAIAPITTGATCGRVNVPSLPEGHRALSMIFGDDSFPVLRQVVVMVDAKGEAYEYVDNRNPPPGSDPATAGRALSISVDIVRQRAMIRYTPGGPSPAEFYMTSGGHVLTAEAIGSVTATAAKIVAECGGK